MDPFNTLLAMAALLLSAFTLYRDKFYFRGPMVTLANQGDWQHSMVLPYRLATPAVRDQFPAYDESSHTALIRAVWLNTGDRATYVHIKTIGVTDESGTVYPCSFYNYVDVPASAATIQLVLLRDLPAEARLRLHATITFEWQRIRATASQIETGYGTIKVQTVRADEPRLAEYPVPHA